MAKGLKRKGGLGFFAQIDSLTEEEKLLIGLDFTGLTVYDIGGYEGIFTIFFARAVGKNGRVVTFEANPENCKKIVTNVRINRCENVEVRQVAVGEKKDKKQLGFSLFELGSPSLEENIRTATLRKRGAKTIQVDVDTLDDLMVTCNLPRPHFVKIDVEGLEMEVLLGMVKAIELYKPHLFIEVHGINVEKKKENAMRILDFLIRHGYAVYHVESKTRIELIKVELGKEGHLYCVSKENAIGRSPSGTY